MTEGSGNEDRNTGRALGHPARSPASERGHDRTGSSVLSNMLVELARRGGRELVIVVGDRRNPKLAGRSVPGKLGCASTPGEEASGVKDWIAALISQANEPGMLALIDMGGGDRVMWRDGPEL